MFTTKLIFRKCLLFQGMEWKATCFNGKLRVEITGTRTFKFVHLVSRNIYHLGLPLTVLLAKSSRLTC